MNYLKIERDNVLNGDGLRVVLWLSGCSHHCYNCQNPQTWNPDGGILFDEQAKQELFMELSKDYISGITLSGGDPLYENNLDDVYSLLVEIKEKFPTKTVWLYTGYGWYDIWNYTKIPDDTSDEFYNFHNPFYKKMIMRQEIIKMCDVVVDGEYIDRQRDITLKWRGSNNQRVIDVQKTLKSNNIILYCK